jgi:phosphatidylethanolamine/phosphatidyl-N-methylethanolamine N-methyltransferase
MPDRSSQSRPPRASATSGETTDGGKRKVDPTAKSIKRRISRTKAVVRKTRSRVKGEVREAAAEAKRVIADAKVKAAKAGKVLGDQARFLKSWIESPLTAGAVAPSGPHLARQMASYLDPQSTGIVVELGPGTGPVTEAILARGIAPQRLILIEYDGDFCALLRHRFPGVSVVQGDAYGLAKTLAGRIGGQRVAAFVSSLPLLTRPIETRAQLLAQALAMSEANAPFIQFTYGLTSPVPLDIGGFTAKVSKRIWRNVPPARVWVYRGQPGVPIGTKALAKRPRKLLGGED